ncbi:MAG TPA: hypothetical protein VF397_15585 [Pyrinomonadaceae bacterium]
MKKLKLVLLALILVGACTSSSTHICRLTGPLPGEMYDYSFKDGDGNSHFGSVESTVGEVDLEIDSSVDCSEIKVTRELIAD